MIFKYKVDEQDFLDFQLFTASKSDRINKKKRNGSFLLTLGSILIALYFYFNQNNIMAIYFGIVAIFSALFYPRFFKWKYKKHYAAYIKENYAERFGLTETLEINNESLFSKNKTGEGKIHLSEIKKIDETGKHFFLKLSTGVSLLIPKNELTNVNEVRNKFEEFGLKLNNEIHWKW